MLLPNKSPFIISAANRIQEACRSYDSKRRRGFPYWAGHAIAEIDILAAAIKIAVEDADKAHAQPRNPFLVKLRIDEALEIAPKIIEELQNGPSPVDDAVSQAQDVLESVLNDDYDSEI